MDELLKDILDDVAKKRITPKEGVKRVQHVVDAMAEARAMPGVPTIIPYWREWYPRWDRPYITWGDTTTAGGTTGSYTITCSNSDSWSGDSAVTSIYLDGLLSLAQG